MSKNAKDLRRRPRNCSGITVVPVDNFDAKVRAACLILSWVSVRSAKGEASPEQAQSDVSLSLGVRNPSTSPQDRL
jgi:hypothetical protein